MNIEELKLILETIKEVAQTAGYAGIAWVVIHYMTLLAQAVMVPICVCIMLVKIARISATALADRKKQSQTIAIDATIDGMCITRDGAHRALIAQLDRLRGKGTGIESSYIHGRSVVWLREAIDAREELDRKEKTRETK